MQCSREKCISDVLSNDKILNCPPPGCSDESDCINNEKAHVTSTSINGNSSSSSSTSSAYIIVPIVVIVLGALAWIVLCFKKKKPTTNTNEHNNDEHVQELRPTTRSDLDSYLEFQDVRPVPLGAPQQHERPMPSAPPIGFKDDPPAYDALFNSNPSKRTNV